MGSDNIGTPFKSIISESQFKGQDFDDDIRGVQGYEDDDEKELASVFKMYQMGDGL